MPTIEDWGAAMALRDGVLLQIGLLTLLVLWFWSKLRDDPAPQWVTRWALLAGEMLWLIVLGVSVVNVWTKSI